MLKDHKVEAKTLLIYNPNAGKKRKLLSSNTTSLEEILELFTQYQIPVECAPTQYPSHATELARQAVHKKYSLVLAAGGDGTVGEVANGLIGSDTTLGIIPLGSYMNIAQMLAIPKDLEKAVALLKINRTRKIDVGVIHKLGGKFLKKPHYFLEGCGFGLEAEFQNYFLEIERGKLSSFFKLITLLFNFYNNYASITIDDKQLRTKATLVTVSNGPITGANLEIAPKAKLNDHSLTVSFYKMTKWELVKYFFTMKVSGKTKSKKIERHQGQKVRVETEGEVLVHADATLFGTTPVEFSVLANGLNVITGFPKSGEGALLKRTVLDP